MDHLLMVLMDQLSAASSTPTPWPDHLCKVPTPTGPSLCIRRWSQGSRGKTHPQHRPPPNKWDAGRDDTGHNTSQSLGFDNHGRIKGKSMAKSKKHWKCKFMAVKPSDWALCWVQGQIQWPSGNLTCWMSQEYALLGIRQCHVTWLQQ